MDSTPMFTAVGDVTDVFAHRFILQTATGRILADLGPHAAKDIGLTPGDHIEISGDMKPSELKVTRFTRGGLSLSIDHPNKPLKAAEHGDPTVAIKTAEDNGLSLVGAPHRKRKHFEVLGRDQAGDLVELHIAFDGELRKSKAGNAADPKWAV